MGLQLWHITGMTMLVTGGKTWENDSRFGAPWWWSRFQKRFKRWQSDHQRWSWYTDLKGVSTYFWCMFDASLLVNSYFLMHVWSFLLVNWLTHIFWWMFDHFCWLTHIVDAWLVILLVNSYFWCMFDVFLLVNSYFWWCLIIFVG